MQYDFHFQMFVYVTCVYILDIGATLFENLIFNDIEITGLSFQNAKYIMGLTILFAFLASFGKFV